MSPPHISGQRLVYTESISNERGNIQPPSDTPAPDSHPITTEVRVELHDLGGRTKMVLTHVGSPRAPPGAIGWAMALDKLDVVA